MQLNGSEGDTKFVEVGFQFNSHYKPSCNFGLDSTRISQTLSFAVNEH